MNLTKHREFFDPDKLEDEVHIIGCGAVGSTIAELMARLGIKEIHLYDFDVVSEHNITNQMFLSGQIGKPKTLALKDLLTEINPEMKVILHAGWKKGTTLSGYVFMCVDKIDTRKAIIEDNRFNVNIKYMMDTRMRLTDAQHYCVKWDAEGTKFLLDTMQFTSEEAAAATPTSACGTTLSVTPTVRIICSYAVSNFINITLNKTPLRIILIDAFSFQIDAFTKEGPIEK